MRILQVHARYRVRAGEDTVVDHEAAALERGGHVVERVVVDNPTGIAATIGALGRSLHNRPMARMVARRIETFGPDVVHVHNTWFSLSASVVGAAAASGVPVVMTLHNFRLACVSTDFFRDGDVCTACLGRSPVPGVVHGCYRDSRPLSAVAAVELAATRRRGVLDRSVTRFVAPSAFMAARLADMGLPAERIVVKPHFTTDPGRRPAPPSAGGEIVAVSRLARGKGIDTLLAAWARSATAASGRVRLVVIGDGPLRASLTSAATRGVELVGWRDRTEVAARLARARALVAPSELYETFGMVLVEAMGAGLPVIVTNVAGAPEIVGGPPHLVVGPRDPDALARAIDALDDATVDAAGAANRLRFEEEYSEVVGLRRLEDLYRSVLPDRATVSP